MKRFLTLFLLLFSLTFLGFAADTYYVKPTGSDSNTGLGTTDELAWETITKANTTLTAGDTVEIMAGTYSTNDGNAIINPDNDGTSGNPITYTNYSTDTVILRGVIRGALLNKDYITIDGLTMGGVNQASAVMEQCVQVNTNKSHCIIQNCTLRYLKATGVTYYSAVLLLSGTSYNQVLDNIISHVGSDADGSWGDGVKLGDADCTYNLIEGNTISHCGHSCILLRGDHNIIKGNTLDGNWQKVIDGGVDDYVTVKSYNVVEGNIIRNSTGLLGVVRVGGFQCQDYGDIIRRNRIYTNSGIGMWLYSQTKRHCMYNKIYHNTVYNSGTYGTPVFGYGLGFTESVDGTMLGMDVRNNIFYNNLSDGVLYADNPGFAVAGDHNVSDNTWNATDPKFTDAGSGDFTIPGSSPCVGAAGWLTTITSASDLSLIHISEPTRPY